jgi:uncharacterized protein YchJ
MNSEASHLPDEGQFLQLLTRGFRLRSATTPLHRERPRLSRNERCYCGSGLKYKRCCWTKDNADN